MYNEKDPLSYLGPSLFLSILSYLPYPSLLQVPQVCQSWQALVHAHKTGIWRPACVRAGVEQNDMDSASGQLQSTSTELFAVSDYIVGNPVSEVEWKDLLKRHVLLDRNWRFGRCREKWISGGGNAIWRFKIDEEQGTCLMTSRTGGLHVVDFETSSPIFSMRSVRPFAHLEFCKGFAIFDIGSEDLTLQVYRTQPAISRSPHPDPSGPLPREAVSSLSHTHPAWRPPSADTASQEESLPRGHLAFYRKITPPTACRAFRARVDREGTEEERAMLGTAGEGGVYLWDLDDEGRKEVVDIPPSPNGEEIGIQYLEFDDDHIFLCGQKQLHIYSRRTKKRILTFPPIPCPISASCAAVYSVNLDDESYNVPLPHPSPSADPIRSSAGSDNLGPRSIVGQAELEGKTRDHSYYKATLNEGLLSTVFIDAARLGTEDEWPPVDYDFSACHYTPNDLVCSSRLGHLIITRDYASILALSDPQERLSRWTDQTIITGLGEPIELLAVDRTHVTASTPAHLFFLDTSTLPTLPLPRPTTSPTFSSHTDLNRFQFHNGRIQYPDGTVLSTSPIKIHSILSVHPYGIREASCAQITKTGIFYTYYALGELEAGVGRIVGGMRVPEMPDRAVDRFGICVRGWDFRVDP